MSDAWTEVKSFQVPVHNFDEQAELVGKYVEEKQITGGFKTSQYIIESEGEKVAVWASFQLAQLFADIEVGTEVKIVFTGLREIGTNEDGTPKKVKTFQVFTK